MPLEPGFCFKSGGRCTQRLDYKPKQVFAAFPFTDDYCWLFDNAVKPVVEGLETADGRRYRLKLIDARQQTETRDFMCAIVEGIRSSRYFIADLSLQKTNVYLELGIALGLGLTAARPFVLISSFEEPPSADISSVNMVRYQWDRLDDFKARLRSTCLDTFRAAAPARSIPVAAAPLGPAIVPQGDAWLRLLSIDPPDYFLPKR